MEEDRNRRRGGSRSSVMESLSLEINKYPKDLLQRFIGTQQERKKPIASCEKEEEEEEEEEEETKEVELNLGLSLGGRFGVEKTSKKLTRSSSIIGTVPLVRDHDSAEFITRTSTPASSYPLLTRSSSLPSETEEEWRKRKEMQCLRRMEAKRRRTEKQKSSFSSTLTDEESRQLGMVVGVVNGNRRFNLQQQQSSSKQGCLESQGGNSSVMSELESKPFRGIPGQSCGIDRSLQERNNKETIGSFGKRPGEDLHRLSSSDMENLSNKLDSAVNRGKEKEIGANMPCVFTKGGGPHGRRVDGILYTYGKGEEVRIMCVCHGSFLSPAEFVKHAGGGDVAHPLRHIVINPSGVSSSS